MVKDAKNFGDFLKRIRTVHLALVIASFGLCATFFGARDEKTKRSLAQLNEIEIAIHKCDLAFENSDEWLTQCIGDAVHVRTSKFDLTRPEAVLDVEDEENRVLRLLTFGPGTWHVVDTMQITGTPNGSVRTKKLENIGEFEQIWNDLEHLQIEHIGFPANTTFLRCMVYKAPNEDAESISESVNAINTTVRVIREREPQLAAENIPMVLQPADGAFVGELTITTETNEKSLLGEPISPVEEARWLVKVPVEADTYGVDAQRHFQSKFFANSSERLGDFSKAFPELAELSEGIRTLPVSELRKMLELRERKESSGVVFLGASIPLSSISVFGTIVLLSFCIYLYLHLDGLIKVYATDALDEHIAWVGVYDNWLARCVTFFTSAVLPPVVVAIISLYDAYHFESPPMWIWAILITGAITGLSFLTGLRLLQLWQVLKQTGG